MNGILKRRLGVLLVAGLSLVFVSLVYYFLVVRSSGGGDIVTGDLFIEQRDMSYVKAIKSADPSVLNHLPDAATLPAQTSSDVARLFELSRTASSFGEREMAAEYMLKIVDAPSAAAEPFRSVAAYYLLNDTLDDPSLMVSSVQSSAFMQSLTPAAKDVFPDDISIDPKKMTFGQKSRYFASYVTALSEREDAFAASGRALSLIGGYYVYLLNSKNVDAATKEKFRALTHTLAARSVARAKAILPPSLPNAVSAYDTAMGLDQLAHSISNMRAYDNARHFGLEKEFSEVADVDIITLAKTAKDVAKNDAVGIYPYAAYVYAVLLAIHSPVSSENDQKVEAVIHLLFGDAPFDTMNEYSWAMKRLAAAKSDTPENIYRRENVAAVARRSPTLRSFLVTKGGWSEKDFGLQDNF